MSRLPEIYQLLHFKEVRQLGNFNELNILVIEMNHTIVHFLAYFIWRGLDGEVTHGRVRESGHLLERVWPSLDTATLRTDQEESQDWTESALQDTGYLPSDQERC